MRHYLTWTTDCKLWEAKELSYLVYINLGRQHTEYMREITEEMTADKKHKQMSVYNTIILSIEDQRGNLFFLDVSGGTLKTFTKKEKASCNISRDSLKHKLLSDCKLNFWDEATMRYQVSFEAPDTALQDLRHITAHGRCNSFVCGRF